MRARRPHALPTGLGRKTTGEVEVGWASELGRLQVGGPGSPSLSVLYFCFLFSIFSVYFDLVQRPNHFQNS